MSSSVAPISNYLLLRLQLPLAVCRCYHFFFLLNIASCILQVLTTPDTPVIAAAAAAVAAAAVFALVYEPRKFLLKRLHEASS